MAAFSLLHQGWLKNYFVLGRFAELLLLKGMFSAIKTKVRKVWRMSRILSRTNRKGNVQIAGLGKSEGRDHTWGIKELKDFDKKHWYPFFRAYRQKVETIKASLAFIRFVRQYERFLKDFIVWPWKVYVIIRYHSSCYSPTWLKIQTWETTPKKEKHEKESS